MRPEKVAFFCGASGLGRERDTQSVFLCMARGYQLCSHWDLTSVNTVMQSVKYKTQGEVCLESHLDYFSFYFMCLCVHMSLWM